MALLAKSCRKNAAEAAAARANVLCAHDSGDDDAKARTLESEFEAGVVSVSASVFVLDALYGAVKERMSGTALLSVGARGQSRHKRVSETLLAAAKLNNAKAKEIARFTKQLFTFRDWAVHPPADSRVPVLHSELDVGVEWRFIAFSAGSAAAAYKSACQLVSVVLTNIRPTYSELTTWALTNVKRLPAALDNTTAEDPARRSGVARRAPHGP